LKRLHGASNCKDYLKAHKCHLGKSRCKKELTPWAPIGGNAPALGIGPTRGVFEGGGG